VLECHCFLIVPPIYDRVGVLSNKTAGTINLSTKSKETQKGKPYKILLNVALKNYNALLNTMLQKYKENTKGYI
jgi:hypothetical protein